MPKGNTVWLFDTVDMIRGKKILGDVACVAGNMPMELLTIGTPQQVKDYAKKLIDNCGKCGIYIMANCAFFDDVKPENVRTMVEFTKEYVVYK